MRNLNLGLCISTLKAMEKARRIYVIWQHMKLSNKLQIKGIMDYMVISPKHL